MKYKGQGLNRDLSRGRISGTLEVNQHAVRFVSREGHTVRFPLRNLRISRGGAGNRLIYMSHPDEDQWRVYTNDERILKDPAFRHHPGVQQQKQKDKQRFALYFAAILLVLAALFLLGMGVWLLSDHLASGLAERVPREWEEKLGDKLFEQLEDRWQVVEHPALRQQLDRIVKPLSESAAEYEISFKVHVFDDPAINALALPGGEIALFSGALRHTRSPEMIAGIIAHEMGHVIARHHTRRLIQRAGISVVLQLLLGGESGVLGYLLQMGGRLTALGYDRHQEAEADMLGWRLMKNARIDPRGMITCFETIRDHLSEEGQNTNLPTVFSTHPSADERIENLKKRWDQSELKPDDFQALQVDLDLIVRALEKARTSTSDRVEESDDVKPL